MNINYPVIISAGSLLFVILTFILGRVKERDSDRENNIKMDIKLDQLCNNTNQILIKFEKHDNEIQAIKTEIAVLSRDVKTAFNQLDELKEVNKNG